MDGGGSDSQHSEENEKSTGFGLNLNSFFISVTEINLSSFKIGWILKWGGHASMGVGCTWEISVPSAQFCFEPETEVKGKFAQLCQTLQPHGL